MQVAMHRRPVVARGRPVARRRSARRRGTGTRAPTPASRGRHGTRVANPLTRLAPCRDTNSPHRSSSAAECLLRARRRADMTRCKGDMTSPRCLLALMTTICFIAFSRGGPLGPLPNVTSSDVGMKQGSCALGDVVYMPGDEFPGASPCERCTCSARHGVQCAQEQCEPRPGCKALHRPDHCCPTYQCECEQEGRVYGNGEKLVDPRDPCRVCYCQGGEVVCRRIACFVRDDCTPRLVPGRCCPEYDNCPLRGVTSLPGMTPAPSLSPIKPVDVAPSPPKDNEPKFTIKEITPVSEIPIITDVKIKEILPSPSIDVAEYSSSKSPLITREATSEKTSNADQTKTEPESPSVVEIHSTETISPEVNPTDESKGVDDAPPSKISFSTQDSINSEIYSSPIVATMGVPPAADPAVVSVATTTKPPVMEEEDPSLFADHNPAFPPLPDDLSVLSSHGDELVPELPPDTDHIPSDHAPTPEVIIASVTPSSEAESKELQTSTTTQKYFPETSVTTTEKLAEMTTETSSVKLEETSTVAPAVKENPTVKLRSAIPTDTFSASSEEARTSQVAGSTTIASEPFSTVTSTTTAAPTVTSTTTAVPIVTSTTTEAKEPTSTVVLTTSVNEPLSTFNVLPESSKSIEDMSIEVPKQIDESTTEEPKASKKLDSSTEEPPVSKTSEEFTTDEPEIPIEKVSFFETNSSPDLDTTVRPTDYSTTQQSSSSSQEQTTNSIAKSNLATEMTSQTELSSLPIETSDQNPHEASENVSKETDVSSIDLLTTTDKFSSPSSEVITVSKSNENGAMDNVETTEFVLTSFGSSETATDAVELIKIAGDSDKSAAIIDHSDGNKNALTDLIKLVSDVASISDHSEPPVTTNLFASTTSADSEELIPVNAGYKSKNSNFNQNSITEVPSFKSKSGTPTNKQKIIEIEDDEDGSITDSPPPNDKVEPTTRRPIIDNVSDNMPEVKTEKKDIEIITQSYVPTINRRPTKVVQQDSASEQAASPDEPAVPNAGAGPATAGPATAGPATVEPAIADAVTAGPATAAPQ